MLKLKSINLAKNLIVAALLALVVFLAACQTTDDPAVETFGLRTEAVEELIQSEPAEAVDSATVPADESAAVAAETAAGGSANANTAGQAARGGQARMADRTNHVIDPLTAADPTQVDIDGLVYMREEEKLARDVYLALYDLWGLPVFQNIAGSEQAHMDSVLMLLEGYGVADPAAGKDPGQFSDPFFQSLYQDLVAKGSASLVKALKVGATIEDLDIVDLQARLKETENVNIIQVYSNLMAGSENHLRAFVSNLERQGGETYQPTYLDQASYEAIIGGTNGNGNGAGGNGGGNGSGGPGNGAGGNGGNGGNGRRNGWGNQA